MFDDRIGDMQKMLARMGPAGRQKYAADHADDPIAVSMALFVNNIAKELTEGKAADPTVQAPVVQQAIQAMNQPQMPQAMPPQGPQQAMPQRMPPPQGQTRMAADGGYMDSRLPEDMGIGALPERSLSGMADGGIVGFAGGGTPKGAKLPSFNDALDAEGVRDPRQRAFLKALHGQESGGGKNTTTSNRGAVGGMQILPGTFKEVADKNMDIHDPFDNARAGIRYALKGYRAAGGDPVLAGAYYYGGKGGMQALAKGEARVDPENPKAPNTLEYGQSIAQRMAKNLPAEIQIAKGETAAPTVLAQAEPSPPTASAANPMAADRAQAQAQAQQTAAPTVLAQAPPTARPKTIAQRLTDVLPLGSARAGELPPTASAANPMAPDQAQRAAAAEDTLGANTATSSILAGLPALAGGYAAAQEMGAPYMRSLGLLKQGTPPLLGNVPMSSVTGRMAAGAAAVPAGLASIGANLSQGAATALTNANDEQLAQLEQSGGGDDTAIAAAILNSQRQGQAAREGTGPALPPVSSYGDQMKNALGFIGKAAVLHPDVTGQGRSVPEREPYSTGEYQGKSGIADIDIGPKQPPLTPEVKKEAVAAAKAEIPKEERSGLGYEDLLMFGLQLMAGKSQYALQNVGEAGVAALTANQARRLADQKAKFTEREADREERKTTAAVKSADALARKYGAEALALEADTKTDAAQRMKAATLAQQDLQDWAKLPANLNATPAQVTAKRSELMRTYFDLLGQSSTIGIAGGKTGNPLVDKYLQ